MVDGVFFDLGGTLFSYRNMGRRTGPLLIEACERSGIAVEPREMGKAASDAIAGSTWVEMKGVGHFPMSENPDAFKEYLLPILDRIAG